METSCGTCHCGCGEKTNIARQDHPQWGYKKGDSMRYLRGHQRRTSPIEHRIDPTTGCWVWQRYVARNGYGQRRVKGKLHLAHRYEYERRHGPGSIPGGHEIHHICKNRACVNPSHLVPIDPREHSSLEAAAGRPLDMETVNQIRQHLKQGRGRLEVADLFEITYTALGFIARGETWTTIAADQHLASELT